MPSMSWEKRKASPRKATPFDVRLGHRLRQVREEKNQSMPQLASKLGITWQMLQKYETGKSRICLGRVMDISNALGVTLTYVIRPLL